MRLNFMPILPYGTAIVLVVIATALTIALPWLFNPISFHLFYAAIAISAWYGGMAVGVVAIALSVLTNLLFLLTPATGETFNVHVILQLTGFSFVSLLISSLCSRLWLSERRAAANLRSLLDSEKRFTHLSKSNILGTVVATVEGAILEANEAFLNMIGYSREDLNAGRLHWRSLTPPELQRVSEPLLAALSTGEQSHSCEHECICKDGSRISVLIGSAVQGSDRDTVTLFVLDNSHRKQAERERLQLLAHEQAARADAEASKDELAKILASITDGFITFDLNWRFTYINREASRTLKRSPEQLLGKILWQVFPGLRETSFGRVLQRIMIEQIPGELEEYLPPLQAWFSVRAYPSDAGLALYFQDITERKQAEATIDALNRGLRRRANELQTLFNVIPISISIAEDPDCHHVRINPTFAQILGIPVTANASYTPVEKQLPLPYKFCRDGRELKGQELPLQCAAQHGIELHDVEVDVVRDTGERFNLFGHAAPLLDEQGKPRGAVAAFIDITERKRVEAARLELLEREKQARQQAEVINRMKDEFLATLSHELRSPLNAILGWAQMLKTRKLDADKQLQAINTIERNARSQAQLIEDLLDVSRIITGKLRLNMGHVDLPLILDTAVNAVHPAADAKDITLRFQIDRTIYPITGDSDRLQQVFWNLLSNAIKFTPIGGWVEVKLDRIDEDTEHPESASPFVMHPSFVQVQISDNGCGIEPEVLPYIFERFRQADSSTTRSYGGLGLGLAIVRHLVELHGGTVHADSRGSGHGATFTVRLPLKLSALSAQPVLAEWAHPTQPSVLSKLQSSLTGVRVLVVDDEADTRDIVRAILEQCGAEVMSAASATEAIALIQQTPPDVLVSDIGMPREDGYSLIQKVQSIATQQGKFIPAAALTAYARDEDQSRALEAGFQTHLTKPIEPDTLVETVAHLVKH